MVVKSLKKYNQDERLMLAIGSLEFAVYLTERDLKNYLAYKEGTLKDISLDQDMEVLSMLEKLGYPMNEVGTYLYKNMIVKAVEHLNTSLDNLSLISQLKNGYSQFYVDVARNDLDIGIKTFHELVTLSLSKVDYSLADTKTLSEIFSETTQKIDYGEFAYILAAYITGNIKNKEIGLPKIKKLVNTPKKLKI